MSTGTIGPKLRQLVRDLGKAIVMRFAGGPFPIAEYEAVFRQELSKYDLNHPDFIVDIARTFVKADVAERSKLDPFRTNSKTGRLDVTLFKPSEFAKGIIRLGNREVVRYADATAQQWIARQLHQQQAAEASQQAATKTTLFLQTEPGVLLFENPRMKTHEAMRQACLWDVDEELRESDDDEPEGSDDD